MRARLSHALRELRGNARYRIGKAVARLSGPHAPASGLQASQISSVLVCRINARMGNAVFLTPLLKRIHELMPRAAIDIATAYPKADDLLGALPGVRRIIRFPYKGVEIPWRYLAAVRRVRRERYDLLVDPVSNSTSARIVLLLARSRWRLGYAAADQWAPLTHAVPLPREPLHQAVQPALLLARALGVDEELDSVRLWMPLGVDELEVGRVVLAQAIERRGGGGRATQAFGFFAHATGLKTIDPAYWRAFWDAFLELEPHAVPVEILPAPSSAPTIPRCASLHVPSPRALTAAMAATRLFISADTGPLHLAGMTSVPTVALFRASDPTLFGPLKSGDLVLDTRRCSPREAAQSCRRLWRRSTEGAPQPAPDGTVSAPNGVSI
jgi:ADP-heptose:LPS heptosyltransferase